MRTARASKGDTEGEKKDKSRSSNIKILINIGWNQLKPGKSISKKTKYLFSFTFISNNCVKPNIDLPF